MSEESLINKYRPAKFKDVVGQDDVVASVRAAIQIKTSHAFILTGPAGVGKTSLARICARYAGSTENNITSVPAAIYTGVDDMRNLTTTLHYRPLGKSSAKSIILDEAHRLSNYAWDALLTEIEEPPEWVYWFLCTTDVNKVPSTIKSRCSIYTLRAIPTNDIFDYILKVSEEEQFKASRSVIELCAKHADGSLRRALSLLSVCSDVTDRKRAAELILVEESRESGVGFKLAQALSKSPTWESVRPLLEALTSAAEDDEAKGKETAEGVRHTVRAYFTKVAVNSKDAKQAAYAVKIIDLFSEPCNPADGFSPIVLAVGRVLFAA